ncbi:MAG: caspase family protein, partial [Candidatus Cloacimonetes bacterium]|nr:caspase family protein [Candidatus Cloacimonadota bacterium]
FVKVLGIPADNIYTVHDEKATLGEMRKIFDAGGWLKSNVKDKNAELYIFYAGHGAPATDGSKAFLIPYDGDPNYPAQTGYELETLYANLGALPAKRVMVFLDACFSGADRDNEILLAGARPPTLRVAQPAADAKISVFSASSGAQVSSAYPDRQHGLFSYFLMKGMRGEADLNGDKKITIAEMEQFLQENVPYIARRMGREQDPQVNSADKQSVLIQMK